ncbi:hypothetical protein [Bradyrhizobium japonicum]|uniref:hypothetical protein n=1 Tax=Bradyrhizobium japonicum TaxID=375 RepID=UPI000462B243|nr:hypothetical protein [Bradyrhizobium japonicum]
MTLIVAIPTALGLIIAADSRVSTWSGYCDLGFKITEIESHPRTATFMTGTTTVSEGMNLDPCEHLKHLKFDAADVLREAAERTDRFDEIIEFVLDGTRRFVAANPNSYAPKKGLSLFQGVVASFDAATHRSRLQSFSVNYLNDGTIAAEDIVSEEFGPEDQSKIRLYGEASYLIQSVLHGPGSRFLTERYGRFQSSVKRIAEADVNVAADFAIDLIQAASKTSDAGLRPATGIGGPVDVLLLGDDERPKRLQWK